MSDHSRNADPDYFGIVSENTDQPLCILQDNDCYAAEDRRSEDQRVEESLADARIFLGAEVEARDRLEALTDAEHGTEDEHADSVDDAHGCDGSVAVDTGSIIEKRCREARKTLTRKTRKTRRYDVEKY